MNNFHRFQNFRQFSNLFSQINLIEKATHVTLFWNLSRNPESFRTKFHQKYTHRMQNSTQKMKNRKFIFHSRKMLTIFGWNFENEERCKGVHCVDLGESFPTSIYLQKSASIQPRTRPSGFGGKLNSIFICLLILLCALVYFRCIVFCWHIFFLLLCVVLSSVLLCT